MTFVPPATRIAPPHPLWAKWDVPLACLGLGLWVAFSVLVLVLGWRSPGLHSVVDSYRNAALGWWAGNDIYGQGIDGFLYLPSFAIVFTPLALLDHQVGELLWRLISIITLTYAIWRASRFFLSDRGLTGFGQVLLLILPTASAALRDAQATSLLVALMLLGTISIAQQYWWRAAVLLALGFGIKPLGMVLVLLAAVLYRPLRLPLGTAVLVVLLLPFLNAHPATAWHIYGLAFDKIVASSIPPPGRWSDLTGILATLGIGLPLTFLTILRLAAAFATLQVGYLAVVRQRRAVAALDIFALSVCYLMLMSPRTEENTYVMLAVVLALFAIMLRQYEGERFRYRLLVVFCIALGCHSYGRWIIEPTVFWLKPLLCLAFLPILIEACLGALFYRGALSVEADIAESDRDVRFVPKADIRVLERVPNALRR